MKISRVATDRMIVRNDDVVIESVEITQKPVSATRRDQRDRLCSHGAQAVFTHFGRVSPAAGSSTRSKVRSATPKFRLAATLSAEQMAEHG